MAKFRCIVKVSVAGADRFLKYRNVTNLDRFTSFLNDKHKGWKWYNVYNQEGDQVDNRTNRSK